MEFNFETLLKLKKDVRKAEVILTDKEARYIVDLYYTLQDNRIASEGQIRAIDKPTFYDEAGKKRKPTKEEEAAYIPEPHENLDAFKDMFDTLESNMVSILKNYAANHPIGDWLMSITGIGPVLAAGLLAHIDITQCPTAGHIWSYAGLNPEQKWEKKTKRPWNAQLKTLCWKIGESFVKVSNNPNDVYGKLYKQRKEYEQVKNEAGEYAEQAKRKLTETKIGKDTDAYKSYIIGKLPPAHIQSRSKRYAVKIFLSHLHEYWYEHHYGQKPPAPYPIAILGHAHKIDKPE